MEITPDLFQSSDSGIFNRKAITSIGEYLNYINYFRKEWNEYIWYRGVSNSNYELIPSIYRDEVWNYKPESAEDIKNLFINRASGDIHNRHNIMEWEWYQIMQHHNLPTRLLDWTSGNLVALYFACRNSDVKVMPSVWLLNPAQLNYLSVEKEKGKKIGKVFFTADLIRNEEDAIVDSYYYDNDELLKYPIGIEPPYLNERMRAQKSRFTLHGKDKKGFENLYKENNDFQLVKLKISAENANKIKKDLTKGGITESTLFPDLEGLARELRFEFEMRLQ